MMKQWINLGADWTAALLGWAMLAVGLGGVAFVLITPAWLQHHDLTWRRDQIAAHTHRVKATELKHRQFLAALKQQDPVLMQRLAYHQFHLTPKGASVIAPADAHAPAALSERTPAGVRQSLQAMTRAFDRPPAGVQESPNVADWLQASTPSLSDDQLMQRASVSPILGLAVGPRRHLLLAAAGVCIVMSILAASGARESEPAQAGETA